MADYAKPFLELVQEYQQIPDSLAGAKLAHISGPNGYLHRPEEASEKESCLLVSDYDRTLDHDYAWPDKNSGSVIDTDYTSVIIENALLRYFHDPVGSLSTIAPVSGKTNRIRSNTVAFKANGDDYPRTLSVLPARDVAIGDKVKVVGTDGSDTYTLDTYVSGIVGDVVPGVVGDAYAGDANADAQSYATSVDKTAGDDNCIQVDVEGDDYDRLSDGVIDETYTITVTQGSEGGDFRTARLNVVSASGLDNDDEVAPELEGTHFAIGGGGLRIAFVKNAGASCSSVASEGEVAPDELLPGQTWKVRIKQNFTPVTFASGGSYDLSRDTTYIIRVVRGGLFTEDTAECPQVTVTTTNGVDATGSSRINVTTSGDAITIGTGGVTFTPSGAGLKYGDFYYIDTTAEAEGSMQTLVLGHNLPTEIQDATDLSLDLFIKKSSVELEANKTWQVPDHNWEQSQDEITILAGAEVEVDEWTDVDGNVVALPLYGGAVYVRYREWLQNLVNAFEAISDIDQIDEIQGQLHPDNPLKYGVYKALTTSAGNSVYYTATKDATTLDYWVNMLKKVAGRPEIYNLVPMTNVRAIQNLIQAHVDSQSGSTKAFLRACFLNSEAPSSKAIGSSENTDDGEVITAILEDNPDVDGTQYTRLTVTSDNIDLIADLSLVAGDTVKYFYESDGFGNESSQEFVIEEVVNERTVILATGADVAVSVGQRVEFWRTLTANNVANDYGDISASFADNRVCHVWPDTYTDGELTEVPGYFLCALLAGQRSSAAPHRPLTNVELPGITDVPRSYEFMDEDDLNVMAGKGTWIITKDPLTGTIYTRHALTTSTVDINRQEESIRSNADAVGLALYNRVKPYIGRANVTPRLAELIYGQIRSELDLLSSVEPSPEIGPAVLSGPSTGILTVERHRTQKDKMVIRVSVELPAPFNYGTLYEIII